MFEFKSKKPKKRIKEFGSDKWVANNRSNILAVAFVYLIAAYVLAHTPFGVGFLVMGLLPLIASVGLCGQWAVKPAMALQCFWYLPVLFWYARNEEI